MAHTGMTHEEWSETQDLKAQLTSDNKAYLASTGNVHRVADDFLQQVLVHKPDDVFAFADKFFGAQLKKEAKDSKTGAPLIPGAAPTANGDKKWA